MKTMKILSTLMALIMAGCSATPFYMGQQPTTDYGRSGGHMPETVRMSLSSINVVAEDDAPELYVGGDYGKETPTAGQGAATGAGAGLEFTGQMIAEDPRSLILAPLVLPFAVVTGTVAGATAAKIQQEVQEFRDRLTDDMAGNSDRMVPAAELAETLRGYVGSVAGVNLVNDQDAAASLTIRFTDISVNVDGKDATVSTAVLATLRDNASGKVLYTRTFDYSDRDTLRKWAADDHALWDAYVDNAQRRIARDISENFFETIVTRHVLRPVRTASQAGSRAGNAWDSRLKDNSPTLSWELFLLGGDDYDEWRLGERSPTFDLEIYDGESLVYQAHDIDGTTHDVDEALPACETLYWTVRPVYALDDRTRAGEWMYRASATERMTRTPGVKFDSGPREFWQGFAKIRTRCRK